MIVCLHGLGRTPSDWDGVRSALGPYGPVHTPALAAGELPSPAILVGHSMGAIVALRRAAAAPADVTALVLTSSFFPPARNGRTRAAAALDYAGHRVALASELAARGVRPRPRRNTARGMRSLARLGLRPDAFHGTAAAVAAPVLVVHARHDHHVPVDFALAAAARHPSWTIRILEAGSHDVHVERPADWLAAVTPWLDALSDSTACR